MAQTIFRLSRTGRRIVYNIEPIFNKCDPVITKIIYTVLIFTAGIIAGVIISLILKKGG